jgi:integrating conjugative element relaxase (TIGR03760 family)
MTEKKDTNKGIILFQHHGKKARPTQHKPLRDLTGIVPPKVLLSEAKRAALLQKIEESAALDSSRFETLCIKLLHNFAHQCQSLPETTNSYYTLPCGMLDYALNRTEAALHLLRQNMVQDPHADLSEEQKLWLYALFSAAILQEIGKLKLDYHIELFDTNGYLTARWNPLLERLPSHAKYYHFEFIHNNEDDLRKRLNLLLAYQLMPESGFAWIAEHPQVLAAWLALLNEDPNSAGMLGLILERAKAIAIQRDLNTFLVRHVASGGGSGGRAHRISRFIETTPGNPAEKERLLGAEFIKWLTGELEKGRFSINKIPIMMLPAGLHLTREVRDFFMREHPEIKHWQAVQKGLISLGLLQQGGLSEQNGIVLEKFAVVLSEEVQMYNPATGKEMNLSAIDVMRIQQAPTNPEPLRHLAPSGEWQVAELATAGLQSGFARRE